MRKIGIQKLVMVIAKYENYKINKKSQLICKQMTISSWNIFIVITFLCFEYNVRKWKNNLIRKI